MNDRNDEGLSDALGAIVLISVVALGVTLAGMALLSGPLPARMPALNAEVTNTSDTVFIRHTGGDLLVRGEYRILADGNDRTASFLSGSAVPAQWSVGDTLEYHVPAGQEIPTSIQVVAITANREQAILQVQVRPPTLRPSSSISPTATTTTTTTITTATTTTTTTTATTTTTSTTTSATPTVTPTSSTRTITVSWSPPGLGDAYLLPSATLLSNPQGVSVPTGSSPAFSFAPKKNKYVKMIQLDGVTVYTGSTVGANISYTIPTIVADHTLSATFG